MPATPVRAASLPGPRRPRERPAPDRRPGGGGAVAPASGPRPWVLLTLLGTALATSVAVAAGLLASWWLGAATPGLLVEQGPPWWLAPALRVVRDVAGALTLGLLLLTGVTGPGAPLPTSPLPASPLPASSPPAPSPVRGGVRTAAVTAAVAALAGAGYVVAAAADVTSRPLLPAAGLGGDLWLALSVVGGLRMMAYSAVALLVVAVLAVRTSHRVGLQRLTVGAALATALLGVGGHGTGHEAMIGVLVVHVLAASVWAGGLGALLVLRLGGAEDVAAVLPAFSRLAGLAFVAVALSGLAAVALRWQDGTPTSTWLLLAAGKAAVMVALAVAGRQQRLRVVARARAGSPVPWRDLARVGAAELLLMGLAAGAGAALATGA
ncbi:hypothetical protein [Jannaschia sp. R86511]|uniref:hypothetical protein n=1 Tax=Jannaschia sp. R86511 TaxID=3093853 RepID=UPI0036D2570A